MSPELNELVRYGVLKVREVGLDEQRFRRARLKRLGWVRCLVRRIRVWRILRKVEQLGGLMVGRQLDLRGEIEPRVLREEIELWVPQYWPPRPAKKYVCIERPPATELGAILKIAFGTRVYRDVFEPHIADACVEWLDAHRAEQLKLAKWIKTRCVVYLLWTALMLLPLEKIIDLFNGSSSKISKKTKE